MRKTTFTLAEAAALLSCHKETLRRAIGAGELRAARLGREYRISRTDLNVFWTAQGGGELFAPDAGQDAEEQTRDSAQENIARSKAAKPAGPQQLTLPTA